MVVSVAVTKHHCLDPAGLSRVEMTGIFIFRLNSRCWIIVVLHKYTLCGEGGLTGRVLELIRFNSVTNVGFEC